MIFEHYLLLITTILPLIYRYSFWLYTIQLKEYRWDRFKEYLTTSQWKSALINIWTVTEIPLLIISLYTFINKPFEIIIWNVLFVYFLMLNLFIIRKIIKKTLLKPKITWRLILTTAILIFWLACDIIYFKITWSVTFIYTYLLWLLLLSPIIIFITIFITLPLINYFKNKKINKAITKSNQKDWVIKIWITWSYWKSSIKEYLSSILEQDWKTLKTPDNINTELWVSNIVLTKLKKSYKYFVAEMWAYKIWEIDTLWNIVNHKYWFLTAIWNQHLWLFRTQKNIQIGKSEIANKILKNKWKLYLNWNNKLIRKTHFNKKLELVKYWSLSWCDAKFKIIWIKNNITEFEFNYNKINVKFKTELLWKHNILNLTWVIACCYDLWLKTNEIKKYLKNIKAPKNTLNIIKKKKLILIDDTYNLSENWLYAWLDVINSFKWDKILVMDDILELWNDAKLIHYEIWKLIAKNNKINNVLFCWVNYKDSFEEWLIKWWFNKKNIINNLDNYWKESIILFEWKKAWKYLDKLKELYVQ